MFPDNALRHRNRSNENNNRRYSRRQSKQQQQEDGNERNTEEAASTSSSTNIFHRVRRRSSSRISIGSAAAASSTMAAVTAGDSTENRYVRPKANLRQFNRILVSRAENRKEIMHHPEITIPLPGKNVDKNDDNICNIQSSSIFPTQLRACSPDSSSSPITTTTTIDASSLTYYEQQKVRSLLSECENARFRKHLALENLSASAVCLLTQTLVHSPLSATLHKLNLSRNRKLISLPNDLVQSLPMLKHFDLTYNALEELPSVWDLPNLKRLNLSHNRITEFPNETMLKGLPKLLELNLYNNKITAIIVPREPSILGALEVLNVGKNELHSLPRELDQLSCVRILKVMQNRLDYIPENIVCNLDLRTLDVFDNPLVDPPLDICVRGIGSMRKYFSTSLMHHLEKEKDNNNRSSSQSCDGNDNESKTATMDESDHEEEEDDDDGHDNDEGLRFWSSRKPNVRQHTAFVSPRPMQL